MFRVALVLAFALVAVDQVHVPLWRIRVPSTLFDCTSVTCYYVDFVAGADTNNGTSTATPWKHAPGDANATNNANITLSADKAVVFKGGVVYSGQITVNASGTSGHPITFISGDRTATTWGTGRGIVDGGSTRPFGFSLTNRSWIDIQGLEIRNVGGAASDAAAINYEGGDNNRVRYCLIHDVNWSGNYVIAYGIENNHGSDHTYEYNEIYNTTDKAIELYGGGGRNTNDANDAIIRYNVIHDTTVHGIVLTSDNSQVYSNLIYQVNNGVRGGSPPAPGYCVKVDQGTANVIYNNICYTTNSGLGVLVGDNNKFYSNTIYSVGGNDGGTFGSRDEVCIALYDDNSSSGWTTPKVVGNEFKNNLCNFLAGSGSTTDLFIFVSNLSGGDEGTGNLIQNNLFFKTTGDTTSTAARVRTGPDGSNVYYSVAGFEAGFDTIEDGSGNVASGNIVANPTFSGGAYNAVGSLPTGFNTGTSVPNATGLVVSGGSPALAAGLTLGAPYNVDITGAARSAPYTIGAYQ